MKINLPDNTNKKEAIMFVNNNNEIVLAEDQDSNPNTITIGDIGQMGSTITLVTKDE